MIVRSGAPEKNNLSSTYFCIYGIDISEGKPLIIKL